jgi:chromosome segregation ATPase
LKTKKALEDLENRHEENQNKIDKQYQFQFDEIQKSIADLRKIKEAFTEIKNELKARDEEDTRRNRLISDWEARMQKMLSSGGDVGRVVEEVRQADSKRLADLQGEVSAMRKRLDETRATAAAHDNSIHHIDSRLTELLTSETDRRQLQTNFLETQAHLQMERDQIWKEAEKRFEMLHKQTETMTAQLQEWQIAQRAVRRAQETYEEVTQKFERRINEVTEMQRLAEDRFRQEWVTFKSDDQKRWTSNTLTQQEQHRDTHTGVKKLEERVTAIEDLTQTQQDILQQTKEATEQLLQVLLAQIHELLNTYERVMGSTK